MYIKTFNCPKIFTKGKLLTFSCMLCFKRHVKRNEKTQICMIYVFQKKKVIVFFKMVCLHNLQFLLTRQKQHSYGRFPTFCFVQNHFHLLDTIKIPWLALLSLSRISNLLVVVLVPDVKAASQLQQKSLICGKSSWQALPPQFQTHYKHCPS